MEKLILSSAADVRDYLTRSLDLDRHTVTFHIAEPGPEFGSGMIDSWENIDMSEAFSLICEKQYDSYNIVVESVITYQIGSGESDSATWKELKAIEAAYLAAPEAFDAYIAEDAEVLFTLLDKEVENPAYEPDEDDEDE